MSFMEEVQKQHDNRVKTKEYIKHTLRECIKKYAAMKDWPHSYARFGGLDFTYLLLAHHSGWTSHENPDEITFCEANEAADFMINFLQKEGFIVDTRFNSQGFDFTIHWGNNESH